MLHEHYWKFWTKIKCVCTYYTVHYLCRKCEMARLMQCWSLQCIICLTTHSSCQFVGYYCWTPSYTIKFMVHPVLSVICYFVHTPWKQVCVNLQAHIFQCTLTSCQCSTSLCQAAFSSNFYCFISWAGREMDGVWRQYGCTTFCIFHVVLVK